MSINPINLSNLHSCLAGLLPVELKGMALLRERHPQGHWFPAGIPRKQMVEAVTELVGYTRRCAYAAEQISQLTSVPLTSVLIIEFGL